MLMCRVHARSLVLQTIFDSRWRPVQNMTTELKIHPLSAKMTNIMIYTPYWGHQTPRHTHHFGIVIHH
jgi:hypothetical protein